MKKVISKDSTIVSEAINELLEEWIPFIHTITSDNGKEFASHKKVAEYLNIDYYFAHPYRSWGRGSNENLNGLIRQYFPKKYDFNLITEDKMREVELKINQRPRKRYNFESPLDRMEKLLFNKKVAFTT
jgi:IS30 family transposase